MSVLKNILIPFLLSAAAVFTLGMVAVNHTAPILCSTDADCASHGYQDAYGVTPEKIREYSDRYYPQELEDANGKAIEDPIAACLLALGYRGLIGDHAEAIYADRDAIESCTIDPDTRPDSAWPLKDVKAVWQV
jgi:hypothetical protein